MMRHPPRSTRTDTLFPYTTLFRSDFVQVYERRVDGRTLTFEVAGEGTLRDAETGSTCSITGLATAGELAGRQLEAVPHYNKIFWYVWSDFNPGTPIYSGE